jgi:hypothetical protein
LERFASAIPCFIPMHSGEQLGYRYAIIVCKERSKFCGDFGTKYT